MGDRRLEPGHRMRPGIAGLRPLIEALAAPPDRTAAVLPCRPRDARAAIAVQEALAGALGAERVLAAGAPGSAEAGELVAATAGTTVLVVGRAARTVEVAEAVDLLTRYGAVPAYAVLCGRKPLPAAAPILVAQDPAAAAEPSAQSTS